jgi:tripartite motif-containing protein 71
MSFYHGRKDTAGSRIEYFCTLRRRGRSRLLPALVSFLLLASPVHAIRLAYVDHLFDVAHRFTAPSDVAVSPADRIYVVDGVNNQIKIFSYAGVFISAFGRDGSGSAEFRQPIGIDIGADGRVYIADAGNHRVQILEPDGEFIAQIRLTGTDKHAADPTDVVVDETRNRCYVVDNDNHRILVYRLSDYRLIDVYGKPGTKKLEFKYPFLIALDKVKRLYIVDVTNTRVQVLKPNGGYAGIIGGWGVEKGEFFRPKGVAVDPAGRVFVSDSYMGVIQVFKPSGEFHAVTGDASNRAVQKFKTPVGLHIDHNRRLYVVEMLANKVSVYRISGESQ